MFENNQKKLHSFVMKLCFKLQENIDQYSTEWNKINYTMFQLKENTVNTVNFFYCNESLIMLEDFITFLKQTYDDVSYEYIVMTKLKTL